MSLIGLKLYIRSIMDLSIIIVNYNVKYFLEQCLCSVKKAIDAFEAAKAGGNGPAVEVIVVDNQSTDGSIAYLQPVFPFVRFIVNSTNEGFSKANNLALGECRGEFVLFLNPDTILPEDCFQKCLEFIRSHPDAGAVGARMIDGSGQYLQESKRGFPSPWVSFCKMTGLTKTFPHSRFFGGYYLGHLPEDQNNVVDVLAGAFMLVRRSVLEQTGGFDEQFFMYAEDIDLSYRIQLAGFRNYYFAGSTILHFKGESTNKDERYIKLFYEAMILFVRKHFKGGVSWLYVKLLELAIRAKAGLHRRAIGRDTLPEHKISLLIVGEPQQTEPVEKLLQVRSAINIVQDNKHATHLLFCEGAGLPFKSIIERLGRDVPAQTSLIHGSSTGSMVGSHSKERQGMAIALK